MRGVAASSLVLGLLAVSCGSSPSVATTVTAGSPTPTGVATPQDLPGEANHIPAGAYLTRDFRPRMLLTFPDKVWGNDEDLPQFLALYSQGNDADKVNRCTVLFLSPTEVFDPLVAGRLDPPPTDLVAWLSSHPYLTVQSQTPATIGGISGTRLTFTARTDRTFPDEAFGLQVKFLFPIGVGGDRVPPVGVGSGQSGSVIVVQVADRPLVVLPDVAHAACDFSVFGPQQQALLTTLRFVP